jgi:hypothetical protein
MRRMVTAVRLRLGTLMVAPAVAAALVVAPAVAAAHVVAPVAAAADPPDPGLPTVASTPPATSPPGTALPQRTADDPAVCAAAAQSVGTGLTAFLDRMQVVSDQAAAGDLVAAELSVRQAGAALRVMAGQLRVDAASATSADMRTAVGALAAEFDRLGASLTTLAALSTFDTSRLSLIAARMSELCGTIAPEFASPSPTATPTPAPTPVVATPPGVPT